MTFQNSRPNKIIFFSSIAVSLFWLFANKLDLYQYAAVGAIFELLWLPMVLLLFILPALSVFHFLKDKYNPRSLMLYSAFLMIITILIMVFGK